MGLNKKFVKMRNDKRAEMGVGTMIVFIAMVLVAAVAASVLISTANTVREQAQSTGDQAINNVASGFIVQDVIGQVDTTDYQSIDQIHIYLRLAAGSPQINMNNVMLSLLSDTTNLYQSMGTAVNDTSYTAEVEKSISGNFWDEADMDASHVVGQGDLIKITVSNTAGALGIGFNQLGVIKIMPAYGQLSLVQFTTSEAFTPGVEWVTLA
jgi:flagellin FlaB